MKEFLSVGAGGFLGACLRFALTRWAGRWTVPIPPGTLLSNAAAGLLIGLITGLEMGGAGLPARGKLFLTTGLLGGLSTFSTFSLETVVLLREGRFLAGAANILLNLALSLGGAAAGLAAAGALKKNWPAA